jgi:hypothetical protein
MVCCCVKAALLNAVSPPRCKGEKAPLGSPEGHPKVCLLWLFYDLSTALQDPVDNSRSSLNYLDFCLTHVGKIVGSKL